MKTVIILIVFIFSTVGFASTQIYSCNDVGGSTHLVALGENTLTIDGQGPYVESPNNSALDPFGAYELFHSNNGTPPDVLVWRLGNGALVLLVIPEKNGEQVWGQCSKN